MESQFLNKKSIKSISLMAWSLIGLSIFSCCSRPDYNVIIGFLVLLLRSYDSSDKKLFFCKAAIHIILLSCIFDIFWIFKYTSLWRHGEETSDLWKSLTFIHNSVYFCGFIELILKMPLILFYYKQFKMYGTSFGELFSLKYSN